MRLQHPFLGYCLLDQELRWFLWLNLEWLYPKNQNIRHIVRSGVLVPSSRGHTGHIEDRQHLHNSYIVQRMGHRCFLRESFLWHHNYTICSRQVQHYPNDHFYKWNNLDHRILVYIHIGQRSKKILYWCGIGVLSYELRYYDFKEHMINLNQDAGVYLKHIL